MPITPEQIRAARTGLLTPEQIRSIKCDVDKIAARAAALLAKNTPLTDSDACTDENGL